MNESEIREWVAVASSVGTRRFRCADFADQILLLATQGFSVPTIRKTLMAKVGAEVTDTEIRYFLQRKHPDMYKKIYERPKARRRADKALESGAAKECNQSSLSAPRMDLHGNEGLI